jgi:hypothetical protein
MKTIKQLIESNSTHTLDICDIVGIKSNDYFVIRTIYQALTSYKHGIKLIGDTEDICIYTNKNIHNMNMQQMMDMQVSVDKRYNIFVA